MTRCHRALVGILAAGVVSAPLLSTAIAAPPKKPTKKPAAVKGDAKAGKTLFGSEGCTGCHKSKDFAMGGNTGPDLSTVGSEHKLTDIQAKIMNPKKGKPDSIMPATKDPKKAAHLAAYLATQK